MISTNEVVHLDFKSVQFSKISRFFMAMDIK